MGASSSQIFITTIFATSLSTVAAVISVKMLSKMDRFKLVKRGINVIDNFILLTNQISKYIIPFLLVGIPFYGLVFKNKSL